MKNMKIRKKLFVAFAILISLMLVIGVIGIGGMSSILQNENTLFTISYNQDQVRMLQTNIRDQRIAYRDGVLYNSDPERRAKAVQLVKEADEEYKALLTFLDNNAVSDVSRGYLKEIRSIYENEYVPARQILSQAIVDQETDVFLDTMNGMGESLDRLLAATNGFADFSNTYMGETKTNDETNARNLIILLSVIGILGIVCAVIFAVYIAQQISVPVNKMVQAAKRLSIGDVTMDIQMDSTDEIGDLGKAFHEMIEGIKMQSSILEKVASGDYTVDIPVRSENDVMNKAIRTMISTSHSMLSEILNATNQVSAAAQHISEDAQLLATGSSEQAATTEEFSAALNEVMSQTESNSQSARTALSVTVTASEKMTEGNDAMQNMLESMRGIDESSKNMAKVIKVIEDIAFQTNILALNAAVEAARAGQHGKGFAVVADEVRNLASKSAAAAQETSALIDGSSLKVDEGNQIVERMNVILNEISSLFQESNQRTEEIVDASASQATSISQINEGIQQISTVVQTNSETAERSAAAAEQLSAQSVLLLEVVSRFKLDDDASSSHAHTPQPARSRPEPVADVGDASESGFALAYNNKY